MHIDFLRQQRKQVSSNEIKFGINISILLHCACSIEGHLEERLKDLLKHREAIMRSFNIKEFSKRGMYNTYINKLNRDFELRVSRTIGIENYDSILKLFSYKRDPQKLSNFKYFEGVRVLFQLRNVLAHGREASAENISAYWTSGAWEELFFGGYKKTEDYLYKNKVFKKKFSQRKNVNHLFTNRVADHFYRIYKCFIRYADGIITDEMDEEAVENVIAKELSITLFH